MVQLMVTVEGDAWTAGVDQFRNLVFQTGADHVPSANRVGSVKVFPLAPDACHGCGVENAVNFFDRLPHLLQVSNVSVYTLDVHLGQTFITAARHGDHFVSSVQEFVNEVRSEKSVGSGNKGLHLMLLWGMVCESMGLNHGGDSLVV